MTDARRWLAIAPDRFAVVPLDLLTALFDRRSGETHLLASPLPEILAALTTEGAIAAMDLVTLLARLDAAHQVMADGDDRLAALAARLDELVALGLVEAAA